MADSQKTDSKKKDPPPADDVDSGEDAGKAATGSGGKKKSKKSKAKKTDTSVEASGSASKPASKLTEKGIQELLEMNPSLKAEMAGMPPDKAAEALRKLDVADLLTGMSIGGKNQKDMASYKFWQTQPVPRFDETAKKVEEGPIKVIDPEKIPKEPRTLYEGFEWCIMDLTDDQEMREVFELLTDHYVEDGEAMFRLNYSAPFLNWALKAPGWRKEWHIGVRATKSKKLVAFISAIPVTVRVRENTVNCSEVNFLCVHKKLRSKRLAPVLIEEITRQCYLVGIYQAIYTAGTVVPTPISSCRYFHRPLDWKKLHDVGFSPLPPGSTMQRQITRNYLPSATAIPGIRLMEKKDVTPVRELLQRYGKRFALAPVYSDEETTHWFVHDPETSPDQVVWTYVVEDPRTSKITDFCSFYVLPSKVIGNPKYDSLKAAYLFFYATEAAFKNDDKFLKERLNAVIQDTLVMAKKHGFDVFNALTFMDNPLFLEQQKFGKGDGQLHYYLFNYRTALIPGGVDSKNNVDEKMRGGIGMALF